MILDILIYGFAVFGFVVFLPIVFILLKVVKFLIMIRQEPTK